MLDRANVACAAAAAAAHTPSFWCRSSPPRPSPALFAQTGAAARQQKLNFVDAVDSPGGRADVPPGRAASHYIRASPSLSNPSFLIAARLFCADSQFVLYSVEGLDTNAPHLVFLELSPERRTGGGVHRPRHPQAGRARLAGRRREPGDGRGLREERARLLRLGRVAIVLRLEHGPLRLDAAAQGGVGDGHRELLGAALARPAALQPVAGAGVRRARAARLRRRRRRERRGCRRPCRAGRGRPTSSSTPRRAA